MIAGSRRTATARHSARPSEPRGWLLAFTRAPCVPASRAIAGEGDAPARTAAMAIRTASTILRTARPPHFPPEVGGRGECRHMRPEGRRQCRPVISSNAAECFRRAPGVTGHSALPDRPQCVAVRHLKWPRFDWSYFVYLPGARGGPVRTRGHPRSPRRSAYRWQLRGCPTTIRHSSPTRPKCLVSEGESRSTSHPAICTATCGGTPRLRGSGRRAHCEGIGDISSASRTGVFIVL